MVQKLELSLLNDSRSPRVTRDQLVLGPDGLINKTFIALLYGDLPNLYQKKKRLQSMASLYEF